MEKLDAVIAALEQLNYGHEAGLAQTALDLLIDLAETPIVDWSNTVQIFSDSNFEDTYSHHYDEICRLQYEERQQAMYEDQSLEDEDKFNGLGSLFG